MLFRDIEHPIGVPQVGVPHIHLHVDDASIERYKTSCEPL